MIGANEVFTRQIPATGQAGRDGQPELSIGPWNGGMIGRERYIVARLIQVSLRVAQRSISTRRGGWPVRRMPMRKILPDIHKAPPVAATNKTSVPTRSNNGGSA